MNDNINYQNSPLHGVGLKELLTEIVDHYGFEILYAYLNINCFKTKPSIESSVKFLKKTDWAREKVESFYLYQFKNLPRATPDQFALPPRDRVIPQDQTPGEPAELSLEDAERLRRKREEKAAMHGRSHNPHQRRSPPRNQEARRRTAASAERKPYSAPTDNNKAETPAATASHGKVDPWAKARTLSE